MSNSEYRLGDRCVVKSSSRVFAREYIDKGIPFFSSKDVIDKALGQFDHYDLFISEARFRELKEKTGSPKKGDLLISSVGNRSGQSYVVGDEGDFYFKDGNIIWLSEFDGIDPYCLSYWLKSRIGQNALSAVMIGSAQKALTIDSIRNLRVYLPPLDEQRAIAHILGTFDDKIELNRRMNETLEAIARAIFKSWFVDFDPVRAKASGEPADSICRRLGLTPDLLALFPDSFQESELGEIPKGWEIGTFGDVAENIRRSVQANEIDPTSPYIGLEHMPRGSIALHEWSDAIELESNKFAFIHGEILFGKLRPYFHKVGVAPLGGVCSTDILVLSPKEAKWFGFVLGHASSAEFVNYTNASSTGTKMPRTSWQDMTRYPVVLPLQPIADAFNRWVSPLIERIIANVHEGRPLSALRDTLLPKLLSGELRVKEAEKMVEAAW